MSKAADNHRSVMSDAVKAKLLQQIGDYDNVKIDRNVDGRSAFELIAQSGRVNESEDPLDSLYAGVQKYEQIARAKRSELKVNAPLSMHGLFDPSTSNPHFFRRAFIRHLQKQVNEVVPPYQVKEPDLRETNPKSQAISLKALLGSGHELFLEALKEEMQSKQYRQALFNKSATFYPGRKWAKRLQAIIGGASASGKTFATKSAIERTQSLMGVDNSCEDEPGNFVLSKDGGIVREMSQMRNLVIEAAVSLGYPGISDLHDDTKEILEPLKKRVEQTAEQTKDFGITRPLTFTGPKELPSHFAGLLGKYLKSKIVPGIRMLTKAEDTDRALFIMVQPKEESERQATLLGTPKEKTMFEKAVHFMGDSRAFKREWQEGEQVVWGLNQANGVKIPESKSYGPGRPFHAGLWLSQQAFAIFKHLSPNGYSINSYNDLVTHEENGKQMLVSKKVLKRWQTFQNYLRENPDSALKIPCKTNTNSQTIFSQEQLLAGTLTLGKYRELCDNLQGKTYSINKGGVEVDLLGSFFLPSEMETSSEVDCTLAIDGALAQLSELERKQEENPGDIEKQLKIMRLRNITNDLEKLSRQGAANFTNPKNRDTLAWIHQDVLSLKANLNEKHRITSTSTIKALATLDKALRRAFVEMKVKSNSKDPAIIKLLEEHSKGPGLFGNLFGSHKPRPHTKPPSPHN